MTMNRSARPWTASSNPPAIGVERPALVDGFLHHDAHQLGWKRARRAVLDRGGREIYGLINVERPGHPAGVPVLRAAIDRKRIR